jgi:hypothetical protein
VERNDTAPVKVRLAISFRFRVWTLGRGARSVIRVMTPQNIMLFAYSVTVVCAVLGVLLSFLI